jgi:preprotein translocase subunit SecA
VLNKQREVIYGIRRDILMGEDVDTAGYVEDVLTGVVSEYASADVYPEEWDLDSLSDRDQPLLPEHHRPEVPRRRVPDGRAGP